MAAEKRVLVVSSSFCRKYCDFPRLLCMDRPHGPWWLGVIMLFGVLGIVAALYYGIYRLNQSVSSESARAPQRRTQSTPSELESRRESHVKRSPSGGGENRLSWAAAFGECTSSREGITMKPWTVAILETLR